MRFPISLKKKKNKMVGCIKGQRYDMPSHVACYDYASLLDLRVMSMCCDRVTPCPVLSP